MHYQLARAHRFRVDPNDKYSALELLSDRIRFDQEAERLGHHEERLLLRALRSADWEMNAVS